MKVGALVIDKNAIVENFSPTTVIANIRAGGMSR
jgi:hypothetical protein